MIELTMGRRNENIILSNLSNCNDLTSFIHKSPLLKHLTEDLYHKLPFGASRAKLTERNQQNQKPWGNCENNGEYAVKRRDPRPSFWFHHPRFGSTLAVWRPQCPSRFLEFMDFLSYFFG